MTAPIIKAMEKADDLVTLQNLLRTVAQHDPKYWQQHGRWWRAGLTTRRNTIRRELRKHSGREPNQAELEYLTGPLVEIGGDN